ncbi:cell cycle control Cdc123 [Raphidocelis subcapitata]|uniref:Cell cycle control Cdc123 n=1 Tax=Raphidocelis subcapitata TaxID=307507 RepID=A0A2V0NUU8_9CHLO|nr:cell cycle control Cdc123 [Raphidocelis subcapitata]|eukprot:GBF91414.1 cell cycle control Cdc123 [Raphidocelis subcapitata]
MCLQEAAERTDPSPMSPGALLDCDFGAWHARYGALAPPAALVALSDAFAAFLVEDGIVLGEASDAMPRRAPAPARVTDAADSDDYAADFSSSDSGSGSGDDPEAAQPWSARFPEIHAQIEAAIARLGGAVAPKLNWSSPTDALWVSATTSLRCTSADQVVLLLKSSDRVAYDLQLLAEIRSAAAAGAAAADARRARAAAPRLALRRWEELRPEREFRCFVHDHRPVGVCQRDPSQHFPQLQDPAEQARMRDAVCGFQDRAFGRGFVRGSYAIDVLVSPEGRVTLIDVNPIADTTQPLLFGWQQLPYGQPRSPLAPSDSSTDSDTEDATGASAAVAPSAAAAAAAPAPAAASAPAAAAGDAPVPAAAEAAAEGPRDWTTVPLLLVESAAAVQPGARQACGMPYDMLNVQEGMEDLIRLMRQTERPGAGGEGGEDGDEDDNSGPQWR